MHKMKSSIADLWNFDIFPATIVSVSEFTDSFAYLTACKLPRHPSQRSRQNALLDSHPDTLSYQPRPYSEEWIQGHLAHNCTGQRKLLPLSKYEGLFWVLMRLSTPPRDMCMVLFDRTVC